MCMHVYACEGARFCEILKEVNSGKDANWKLIYRKLHGKQKLSDKKMKGWVHGEIEKDIR